MTWHTYPAPELAGAVEKGAMSDSQGVLCQSQRLTGRCAHKPAASPNASVSDADGRNAAGPYGEPTWTHGQLF